MADNMTIGDFQITRIVNPETKDNCYLVYHEPLNEMLVIDPGHSVREIIEEINHQHCELRYILFTHAHYDVVGDAKTLSEEFSVPCAFQKSDLRLFRMSPQYAMEYASLELQPPLGYRAFNGEPVFFFAGQQFNTVHTPGHTAGSVCYLFDDFVFTGETLLKEGVGEMSQPGASPRQIHESMQKLFDKCEEDRTVFPGKGAGWHTSEAREWWKNRSEKELFQMELSLDY